MAKPSKHDQNALEYRVRAEEAAKAAGACGLTQARQQHEIAAARWIELAETEERRALEARARLKAVTEAVSVSEHERR